MNTDELRRHIAAAVEAGVQQALARAARQLESDARRLLGHPWPASSPALARELHRPYRRYEQAGLESYARDLIARLVTGRDQLDESDWRHSRLAFYSTLADLDDRGLAIQLASRYEAACMLSPIPLTACPRCEGDILNLHGGLWCTVCTWHWFDAPAIALPTPRRRCSACHESAPIGDAVFCVACGAALASEGATIQLHAPQG